MKLTASTNQAVYNNNIGAGNLCRVRRCVITAVAAAFAQYGIANWNANSEIVRNVVYGFVDYGIYLANSAGKIYNCTVYGNDFTAPGEGYRQGAGGNSDIRNCISLSCTDNWSGTAGGSCTHNLSDTGDADIPGGSSQTSSAAAEFVSVTGGSEDFHLKCCQKAADNGTDLGTTADANIDIDGRDVDAEGDTWDIGAHEFVVTVATVIDGERAIHGGMEQLSGGLM
jgi:hypothetical protein